MKKEEDEFRRQKLESDKKDAEMKESARSFFSERTDDFLVGATVIQIAVVNSCDATFSCAGKCIYNCKEKTISFFDRLTRRDRDTGEQMRSAGFEHGN